MLRENNKYNSDSTHFSYRDYRQKVKKRGNKDVTIFISVFIIGLLIILGFVKILSPNVDVGIASEDDYAQYEDDNSYQSSVDSRLKKFQDEDAGKGDEVFSPELDEKVVLPTQVKKTVGEMEAELQKEKLEQRKEAAKAEEKLKENNTKTEQKVQETKVQQPPTPSKAPTAATQTQAPTHTAPVEPIVNAKVVVGYYATDKQAEVAKTIIQDAGLGVTPIVKNMNGYYTLQVGSYNSKEKAQQAANNLLKSNFPARVIVE